ncbi:tRNA (guanosine(37)-N1)-methyltransferase TrmD [Candidatus Microgenomates bacterium]|nr:tRNA (guanosine(37)-N1)-methyltransferase TrmD [Candidatus Microgenomates bacterium]
MKIDIITLFPEMFEGPFSESIIKRAQEKDLVKINIHNLREYGIDERKTVDGRPYSGGPGMLLRVDVVDNALKDLQNKKHKNKKTVLLDATGEPFKQKMAKGFSKLDQLILICGHYEGVDHRIHEHLVDGVISIGDYVLTGGEIPAMVVTDSVARLIPGVLGKDESSVDESHSVPGYLEYPQYTRPEKYNKWEVPSVLLSGNHKEIIDWKKKNQPSPAK